MECSPQKLNENVVDMETSVVISNEKTTRTFHGYRAPAVEDSMDEDDLSNAISRMNNLQMSFADPPELTVNDTATASPDVGGYMTGVWTNFNSAPGPTLGATLNDQSNSMPAQQVDVLLSSRFYGKLVIQTPVEAIAAVGQISAIEPRTDHLVMYAFGTSGLSNHSGASIQYRKRNCPNWASANFLVYGLRSALDVSLFVIAQAIEVAVADRQLERDGNVVIVSNYSAAIAHIQQLASTPESPRNIHMGRIFAFSKALHERGIDLEIHWSPNRSDVIGSARAEGYSNIAKKEALLFFHSKILKTCPMAVVLPPDVLKNKSHQLQSMGRRGSIKAHNEARRYSIATGKMPGMVLGRFQDGFRGFDLEMLEPVRPVCVQDISPSGQFDTRTGVGNQRAVSM
jgi:hypothetical protein